MRATVPPSIGTQIRRLSGPWTTLPSSLGSSVVWPMPPPGQTLPCWRCLASTTPAMPRWRSSGAASLSARRCSSRRLGGPAGPLHPAGECRRLPSLHDAPRQPGHAKPTSSRSAPHRSMDRNARCLALALVAFHPGLIMVDHIHFQYNGMLLGELRLPPCAYPGPIITQAC